MASKLEPLSPRLETHTLQIMPIFHPCKRPPHSFIFSVWSQIHGGGGRRHPRAGHGSTKAPRVLRQGDDTSVTTGLGGLAASQLGPAQPASCSPRAGGLAVAGAPSTWQRRNLPSPFHSVCTTPLPAAPPGPPRHQPATPLVSSRQAGRRPSDRAGSGVATRAEDRLQPGPCPAFVQKWHFLVISTHVHEVMNNFVHPKSHTMNVLTCTKPCTKLST